MSPGVKTFDRNQENDARELGHPKGFARNRITAQGVCLRGVGAESVVPVQRLYEGQFDGARAVSGFRSS